MTNRGSGVYFVWQGIFCINKTPRWKALHRLPTAFLKVKPSMHTSLNKKLYP